MLFNSAAAVALNAAEAIRAALVADAVGAAELKWSVLAMTSRPRPSRASEPGRSAAAAGLIDCRGFIAIAIDLSLSLV